MPTHRNIDAFGQSAAYCSNCHAELTWVDIDSADGNPVDIVSLASKPSIWALAAPNSGFINVNGNHRDIDPFVTSLNLDVSPNQALAGIANATATRDQHIPIWSPSTANNGWNNEWNLDIAFPPLGSDPASQGLPQSLSHVAPSFGQHFNAPYSNAIDNGQPDSALPFPDFGIYNGFCVMPDGFIDHTQWGDLTAIDPQETTASFNQMLLLTTASMPAAPTLPTHATSMFTAAAMPLPIARTSRRSNVNTNPHTCGHAGCGRLFTRPGDLARHMKQHGVPQHPCLVRGCNRHGLKAFYRADKLLDHQRKRHGGRST